VQKEARSNACTFVASEMSLTLEIKIVPDLAYVLVQVPCLLHHPCRLPPAFSQDCSVGGIVSIEFDGSSILDGGIVDSNLLPKDSA
jgi:hypothetical protein